MVYVCSGIPYSQKEWTKCTCIRLDDSYNLMFTKKKKKKAEEGYLTYDIVYI